MRVLMLHNRYQRPGGEDRVVDAESRLLRNAGHDVRLYEADNDDIISVRSKIAVARQTFYNRESKAQVSEAILEFRPDVVHVHNFFPKLSPSVYDAARQHQVAVVQTLHNYRLLCAKGTFVRDGKVCEACVGRLPLPALRYRCYRDSLPGSAVVAGAFAYHRLRRTWQRKVDLFVAVSAFSRDKFVEAGFVGERIVVKPNFVEDRFAERLTLPSAAGALFVGRLSEEKGIRTLLEAWQLLDLPLTIVGDGPLRGLLDGAPPTIRYLGPLPREAVAEEMRRARMLVVPSVGYEGAPLVILEALAAGLPVVASKLGGVAELVEHEVTGLHFGAGDATDLARAVRRLASSPAQGDMRRAAREQYLARFTPERAHENLVNVYQRARRLAR